MTLHEAYAFLAHGIQPKEGGQIVREIAWTLGYYQCLQASMFLSYTREAWCGIDSAELRITFDSDILYRTNNLSMESGIRGLPLMDGDKRLMEIKSPSSLPLWLTHGLDALQIFPSSFSKYGAAWQTAQQNGMGVYLPNERKQLSERKGALLYA